VCAYFLSSRSSIFVPTFYQLIPSPILSEVLLASYVHLHPLRNMLYSHRTTLIFLPSPSLISFPFLLHFHILSFVLSFVSPHTLAAQTPPPSPNPTLGLCQGTSLMLPLYYHEVSHTMVKGSRKGSSATGEPPKTFPFHITHAHPAGPVFWLGLRVYD
jgi:hypothetical protein